MAILRASIWIKLMVASNRSKKSDCTDNRYQPVFEQISNTFSNKFFSTYWIWTQAILADRVVDCTGDADIAYLAGARCTRVRNDYTQYDSIGTPWNFYLRDAGLQIASLIIFLILIFSLMQRIDWSIYEPIKDRKIGYLG